MKRLLLLLCNLCLILAAHAQEAPKITGCDADIVTSMMGDKVVASAGSTYEINCSDVPDFKPFAYVVKAKKIEIVDDGYQATYIQLLTTLNVQGKQQRLNILISDDYADDGQLQGTGAGGYYVEGDKLYAYVYWATGCSFEWPYEVEKTTYQWSVTSHQYEKTGYIYYTTNAQSARGWGCCDYSLLDAAQQLTEEEQETVKKLAQDGELRDGFVWGQQANALLAEAQQRIAPQIQCTSLWRQSFCCRYEEDEKACREQIEGQ